LITCLLLISKQVLAFNLELSNEQLKQLAQKIESNETAGKDEYLTYWSKNEAFPSLGIGHFIWFPRGKSQVYKQTFPQLVAHLSKTSTPPTWLAELKPFVCPWQTRQQFYADFNRPKLTQLRNWLRQTKLQQVSFIYQRFLTELNLAKSTLLTTESNQFDTNLKQLLQHPNALFAVIDYANFKGIGSNQLEVYEKEGKGVGWGLIDVILAIPNKKNINLEDFVTAAKFILKRRAEHAPKDKNEKRWLKGWYKRINNYL